jgi:hypothetical protein
LQVDWRNLSRRFAKEFAIGVLVVLVYSAVNLGSEGRRSVALDHCHDLIAIERAVGIFGEVEAQVLVLDTSFVPVVNAFYAFVHPLVTLGFVAVLFFLSDRDYVRTRNIFVTFSLLSFAVFLLYPTAPPRMTTEYGFVDLLHEEAPVSYQSDLASDLLNPYAAMPSIHFGYSAIIGAFVVARFRKRAPSALGIAHPALMVFSVAATANHLFLDCVAAALLLGVAYFMVVRLDLPGQLARFLRR